MATRPSTILDGQPSRIPDATERARPEFQDTRRIIEDYPTRRGHLKDLLAWDETSELAQRILDAVAPGGATPARRIAELEDDLDAAEAVADRLRDENAELRARVDELAARAAVEGGPQRGGVQ